MAKTRSEAVYCMVMGLILSMLSAAGFAQSNGHGHIQIGQRSFILPEEMRRPSASVEKHTHDQSVAVLLVAEPHWLADEQNNTLLAFQALFRENPDILQHDIVFLGESIEAGISLSLDKLVAVEPTPGFDDFEVVLRSFLIPGHVAISWALGGRIPILGMEDEKLFTASKRVWAGGKQEQYDWTSFICRNQRMAQSIIEAAHTHDYVIAFVGAGHMTGEERKMTSFGIPLGAVVNFQANRAIESKQQRSECDSGYIADFLTEAGIGYSIFSTFDSSSAPFENAPVDKERYRQLMQAQLDGSVDLYVASFGSSLNGGITVSPDPDAAADLLTQRNAEPSPARRTINKVKGALARLKAIFDRKTLEDARNNRRGKFLIWFRSKKDIQHLTEVRGAQNELKPLIRHMRGALENPDLSMADRRELSILLDRAEHYLQYSQKFTQ